MSGSPFPAANRKRSASQEHQSPQQVSHRETSPHVAKSEIWDDPPYKTPSIPSSLANAARSWYWLAGMVTLSRSLPWRCSSWDL